MKAVVFDEIGPPVDVLRLANVEIPNIRGDEVLVRMVAAPINPGDFLFIQNLYPEPKKPHFPQQIAGNYGAGIVEKAGNGTTLRPGTLVSVTHYNTWAEYAVVPQQWVIPLPSDYPVDKAAQFMNLITAWDLLAESKVQPGQWLLLTAANSTVATIILQFAKRNGIRVISAVRRKKPNLGLKDLGATEVIELSENHRDVGDVVTELTNGAGLHAVIDCVGGPLLGDLVRSLALGGRAIIYGGFRSDRFELHNFDVLMRGAVIKSYIYRYFFDPPAKEDMRLLENIAEISAADDFRIPLGGMHSLDDFKTAVGETSAHPERGKRMFKM